MEIDEKEWKSRIQEYRKAIPRLDWFTEREQEAIVREAWKIVETHEGQNFFAVCSNLTFMKSITEGKKPPDA